VSWNLISRIRAKIAKLNSAKISSFMGTCFPIGHQNNIFRSLFFRRGRWGKGRPTARCELCF